MYCYKCGAQIPDNSNYCSHCGTKVTDIAQAKSTSDKFNISFDRCSQVYLINPPIKIVIDDKIRLSVDNGKTCSTQLVAGKHHIVFSASFRSTEIEIDLQKDTVINLSFSRLSGKLIAEIDE